MTVIMLHLTRDIVVYPSVRMSVQYTESPYNLLCCRPLQTDKLPLTAVELTMCYELCSFFIWNCF